MFYRRSFITAIVFGSIAILGVIVLAIVLPIYYQNMLHYDKAYTSLIKRINNDISDTGIIQTYLNECPIDDDSSSWCDLINSKIHIAPANYQTTKAQQQYQLDDLLNKAQTFSSEFFCDANTSVISDGGLVCVCDYIEKAEGESSPVKSNWADEMDFDPKLKKICKSKKAPAMISKELKKDILDFINSK